MIFALKTQFHVNFPWWDNASDCKTLFTAGRWCPAHLVVPQVVHLALEHRLAPVRHSHVLHDGGEVGLECVCNNGGCPYITSSIKLNLELDICFELIMTAKVFQLQLGTGQGFMDFNKTSRSYFLQFIRSKSICSENQKVFSYRWNTQ